MRGRCHPHRSFHPAALALGAALAAAAACSDRPASRDVEKPRNFHVLDEGRAFRSGQPDEEELRSVIRAYGIRTVLNLRGHNPGKSWYDREAEVCADTGVMLVSVPLSSRSLPEPQEVADLVRTLETAEYPILMHCEGGADRSGLAAALYRVVVQGRDRDAALEELSEEYLHFPAMKPCMRKFIEVYESGEAWLEWYGREYAAMTCSDDADVATGPSEDEP